MHSAGVAECGLVCLAMIAKYHGHDVDVNGLRSRISISTAGTTLRSLISIADSLDMSARAVRTELEGLKRIRTPAIIHWDMNHFVVLSAVKGNKVIIHDPTEGRRVYKLEEVSKHFTGVCLELTRAKQFEKRVERKPTYISSLWTKIDGFWLSFGQILVLSFCLQILGLAAPFYIQLMVDSAVPSSDKALALTLAMAFIGIMAVRLLTKLLQTWTVSALSIMLTFQMVGNIVRHMFRLRIAYFESRHVGDILSRIESIDPIKKAFTTDLISLILNTILFVLALSIMVIYSLTLTLLVVASVAIILAVELITFPYRRRLVEEEIHAKANEDSFMMESIRASSTIKLMSHEAERESQWRNYFAKELNIGFSLVKLDMFTGLIIGFVSGLEAIIIVYIAVIMVVDNTGFSIGMLFAFISFKGQFTSAANTLIDLLIRYKLLALHLDRVGDIIHAEPDSFQNAIPEYTGVASIRLSNVNLRYGENTPNVLNNVTLEIKDGDYVAIVGASGGGKTTLLKVLMGLYLPDEGKVYLGGQLANADLFQAWRRIGAAVMQEDRLLAGSIQQNITFFDPNPDTEWVRECTRMACVDGDIEEMPMQLQSLVGDMGSALSGGQKQRILLARALYRRPKIIFMDEGTANLDPASELKIASTLRNMSVTRIVVAHRPALIKDVDYVYQVVDGSIAEVEKKAFV